MSSRRGLQDPRRGGGGGGGGPKKTLEDLPDAVLLRVLGELPQPDLLQVSRVSSRLHGLSRDGALWRDLGTLGPDIGTEQACTLLRNAPDLTALRLHARHDADAILLEASRYCRRLELLELTQCRGSRSFRQLAYLPLVKVAQNCRRLRRVYFWETDFMCSRVFKVWADLRGPEEPELEIGVNSLTRRQANYLTSVLGGPAELHTLALRARPFVMRVHGHALSLVEEAAEEAVEETPGPSTSTRVRPAPSTASTGGEQGPKRPRLEEDPVAITTVFVRQPAASSQSAASTSTGGPGPGPRPRRQYAFDHVNVGGDDSSGESDADNMDVVVASPPTSVEQPHEEVDADEEAENVVIPPSRSKPVGRLEFKSVFGMSCASEPLVNSWFRSGYMPDCDDVDQRSTALRRSRLPRPNQRGAQERQELPYPGPDPGPAPGPTPSPAPGPGRSTVRTALLSLPRGDGDSDGDGEDGPEDSRTVTVTLEVVAGDDAAPTGRLPPGAARLADSLKEPTPPLENELQPGGDLQPDPVVKRTTSAAPALGLGAPHPQHGAVDGDH
ncbi:Ras guanine nucleotide exchange factor G, partial [Frankliniella fusca]